VVEEHILSRQLASKMSCESCADVDAEFADKRHLKRAKALGFHDDKHRKRSIIKMDSPTDQTSLACFWPDGAMPDVLELLHNQEGLRKHGAKTTKGIDTTPATSDKFNDVDKDVSEDLVRVFRALVHTPALRACGDRPAGMKGYPIFYRIPSLCLKCI
jgi:hypothetical protein